MSYGFACRGFATVKSMPGPFGGSSLQSRFVSADQVWITLPKTAGSPQVARHLNLTEGGEGGAKVY